MLWFHCLIHLSCLFPNYRLIVWRTDRFVWLVCWTDCLMLLCQCFEFSNWSAWFSWCCPVWVNWLQYSLGWFIGWLELISLIWWIFCFGRFWYEWLIFYLNCLIDWLPAWCDMSEWFEIGCWIDCMYLRGFLGWWIRIDVAWYLHLLCFALYCWLVGLHSLNGATWLIYFSDIIENGNDRCESQRFAGWFV